MLKVVRDQLDRLHENSPQVPDNIIQKFKKQFGESTPDLSKPNITNGLDPIQVHKEGQSPADTDRFAIRISSGDRTRDTSQTSSSVRPQIESEVDSSRTSSLICTQSTT